MLYSRNRTILIVTAPKTFRDEEYFEPKCVFEQNGIKVVTASTKLGILEGKLGRQTKSDILIDDADTNDYDAVLFVGGGGAEVYFKNETAHKIARSFLKEGKIVSAICIAPVILAYAGILNGIKSTCFIDGKDDLVKNEAIYTGADIEIDGKIITASGPRAAHAFAETIVKSL